MDCLAFVGRAEFAYGVAHVGEHGGRGDLQALCDLVGGTMVDVELEHDEFTVGERPNIVLFRCAEQLIRRMGVIESGARRLGEASSGRSDERCNVLAIGKATFFDERLCACVDAIVSIELCWIGGDADDTHGGVMAADAFADLCAADAA